MSYLPSGNQSALPYIPTADTADRICTKLDTIIPENPNQPYDIKDIIKEIVDEQQFLEIHADFAENIVVGFATLNGNPIGIIANQPASMAGVLDINSSVKGARFVRFCDCFNIPLLVFFQEQIKNGVQS